MQKDFYRIDGRVMGIVPDFDEYGKPGSLVLEPDRTFIVPMKPRHLIDRTLRTYGTSYRGAVEGAAYILERNHNPPVLINAGKPVILFPTTSPSREECAWFALDHIVHFQEEEKATTRITFTKGNSLVADVSCHSFNTQFQKALRFRHQLERPDDRLSQAFEPGVSYHLVKGKGMRNFERRD